nr:hypothetical protein [Streptomyces sp. SID5468]
MTFDGETGEVSFYVPPSPRASWQARKSGTLIPLGKAADSIDAEKAFNEYAEMGRLGYRLGSVWHRVPGTRRYRVVVTVHPTVGELAGAVEKPQPRALRSERPKCDGTARYVEVYQASPFVGASVALRCTCRLTHWAQAVDGYLYEGAAAVPLATVVAVIERDHYEVSGDWTAHEDGTEFPFVRYVAPVVRVHWCDLGDEAHGDRVRAVGKYRWIGGTPNGSWTYFRNLCQPCADSKRAEVAAQNNSFRRVESY